MAENTFLGLQPYTEADAYRFKGRTEESQELFRLIVRNDFTVCYAESGEGKTSLLNAGVFPLLRQNMFFPIAITFTSDDYQHTPDNFDTIIDRCIKDSIADYNENNKGINIEYKLYSTDFQNTDSQPALQQELSKYSWWKLRNYKPQAMGLTFTPVFVFDQFEEVFNLPGSIVWTKKFFDWLEDVSSDSCPDEIVNKVREIIGTNAAFPAIKEEKDFKAVFSLRKEFIGELDYWGMQKCFIPSLKDNRYCLKALTYEGAKKVMTQQQRFEEAKVDLVLRYFVKQYSREPEKTISENLPVIPALLLSVVCDSWEKDIDFFSDIDTKGIDQSLNKILEKFYDEAIDSVVWEILENPNELPYYSIVKGLEDGRNINFPFKFIREDIETAMFDLVDVNGKRVRVKATTTHGTIMLGRKELKICKYKDILRKFRIIRVTKVDGEDYVEIVHDALCSVVAKRQERIMKAIADNELKKVEETEKRKRELLKTRIKRALCIVVVLACAALWYYQYRPINVEVRLNEASIHNTNLPPLRDAVVTLTLDDGDKVDTINSIDKAINFSDVPIRYVGKQVHMGVKCLNYLPIDTTLLLTKNISLNIYRDTSIFGKILFRLWNAEEEREVTNASLEIDGHQMNKEKGVYFLDIPLEKQKTHYGISSTIPLLDDTIYLPCGIDDVVLIK